MSADQKFGPDKFHSPHHPSSTPSIVISPLSNTPLNPVGPVWCTYILQCNCDVVNFSFVPISFFAVQCTRCHLKMAGARRISFLTISYFSPSTISYFFTWTKQGFAIFPSKKFHNSPPALLVHSHFTNVMHFEIISETELLYFWKGQIHFQRAVWG